MAPIINDAADFLLGENVLALASVNRAWFTPIRLDGRDGGAA
jgi:hypothetical protein